MPTKRPGQTQVSLQVPDKLLVAVDAKRGAVSRNAYLCGLAARDTGVPYEPNPVGAPLGSRNAARKPKPTPKPGKKPRKPKGDQG